MDTLQTDSSIASASPALADPVHDPAHDTARSPVAIRPWRPWQCVLFRYALCHWLLYSLPRPLTHLVSDVTGCFQAMGLDVSAAPWSWPQACMMPLYRLHSGWQSLTSWLYEQGLAPYEVIHQRTGSGDTAHAITQLLVVITASLTITAVWTALARRSNGYPRIGRWFHLAVRFDLAFQVAGYGLSKLYGGQFGELSLSRLTQEIGDTAPMTMVGTFMQASKAYELFGGTAEVLGPLLLFHHRTALLGAIVTIGVMANVTALNWLCGVPVKLYSAHLLLFAIGLLAPFGRTLWALLISNRGSRPVDLRVVQSARARRILFALGVVWVLAHLVQSHFARQRMQAQYAPPPKSSIYGVWVVEKMMLDGTEVPAADGTRWRYFAVDRGTSTWVRTTNGRQRWFEFEFDEATRIAKTKPLGGKEPNVREWTCEVGTKLVPSEVPLLLRNEDRNRKVDAERRTLVVKGELDGKQLELHTVEKVFPLLKGFRFRQELPEFW